MQTNMVMLTTTPNAEDGTTMRVNLGIKRQPDGTRHCVILSNIISDLQNEQVFIQHGKSFEQIAEAKLRMAGW